MRRAKKEGTGGMEMEMGISGGGMGKRIAPLLALGGKKWGQFEIFERISGTDKVCEAGEEE